VLSALLWLSMRAPQGNADQVRETDAVRGVRRAGTGMYALVHEDSEHRITK